MTNYDSLPSFVTQSMHTYDVRGSDSDVTRSSQTVAHVTVM